MKRHRRRHACIGFLSFLTAACSANGYSITDLAAEINATRNGARTTVEIGDTLQVRFPFNEEFDHEARVRPDGFASFRLVDELHVAGMRLDDLDARLTDLYQQKQSDRRNIELTVDILTSGAGEPTAVYVIGEVESPGTIAMPGRPLTLIEAISAAGGHKKSTANLHNTILMRRLAGTDVMRSWRLDAGVYSWGSEPPIYLQARDIVFVPNTAIDDVNIWVDKYIRQMLPFPLFFPPQ